MADKGRPWWNTPTTPKLDRSMFVNANESPSSKSNSLTTKPGEFSGVIVKEEPVVSPLSSPLCKPPKYSPILSPASRPVARSPARNSIVKTEPPDIKREPMEYLERALLKGEFPSDFDWPFTKWEPITLQNPVKKETKHHIPKPLSEMEMKLRFAAPPRRYGPPPNWHRIYTRDTYEPSGAAKSWWNADVERAFKKRKEAYLKTLLNDNASVEVRMERLWTFEAMKDEVRKVIAVSKWKAAMKENGSNEYLDGVNIGASTSRDTNSFDTGEKLSILDRLGPVTTVGEVESDNNENSKESLPTTEELENINPDEVQFIPKEKEKIEVLTLDEEIEDAMSGSEDDSEEIKYVGEIGSDDVIFIQKKQGEVTFLAQVNGRLIKMNRKRKLCVTFSNTINTKRKRLITLDDESGEQLTNHCEPKEGDSLVNSLSANDNTERMRDGIENQNYNSMNVEDTSDTISDTRMSEIQEETDENMEAQPKSPIIFNCGDVNMSVSLNKKHSGVQPSQKRKDTDFLTEHNGASFVLEDDEEVAVLDEESGIIETNSRRTGLKEKEVDTINENTMDSGVEIITDEVLHNDKQNSETLDDDNEEIVVLETVRSTYTRRKIIPGDECNFRDKVKEDYNSIEGKYEIVTNPVSSSETEKNKSNLANHQRGDCPLEGGSVEIQRNVMTRTHRSPRSLISTFSGTRMEEGSCDSSDDVLEIDCVSEVELVEKDVKDDKILEVGKDDGIVDECKMDNRYVSSLRIQSEDKQIDSEDSNSCVEVAVVDEVEIIRDDVTLEEKDETCKVGSVEQGLSKSAGQNTPKTRISTSVEQSTPNTRNTRHIGSLGSCQTRQNTSIVDKKLPKKERTERGSPLRSSVCTRSRRF